MALEFQNKWKFKAETSWVPESNEEYSICIYYSGLMQTFRHKHSVHILRSKYPSNYDGPINEELKAHGRFNSKQSVPLLVFIVHEPAAEPPKGMENG